MKILDNAPWWMISAGLHLVLLLGAALVVIERAFAIEVHPIVSVRTVDPPRIDQIETPRDVTGHKAPVPIDPDPAADPAATFVFDPFAAFGPREESEDNDPRRKRKGQDPTAFSFMTGNEPGLEGKGNKGPGLTSALGVGSGFGSTRRRGGNEGGMKNINLKAGGGDELTESAVTAALRWLARHQNADGSWSASGFCRDRKCSGAGDDAFTPGVSALSTLAFLGAGYTQFSKDVEDGIDFGNTVKRALQWLISQQDPEGCVGERGTKYLYNHAIAALALSEAYGMTTAPVLREPAQKSIDFLVAAQNPGKGWRYGARGGDNDTSVTGWAVMALKSAELSGLAFPTSAYQGALNWIQEATEQNGYYRVGYNAAGTGKVFVPGKNELFADHASMSAVAVMSRIFMVKKRSPELTAVNHLVSDLPAWNPGQVDFYYWYYASLALFQYDGPKGPFWTKWNGPMKNALVPNQKTARNGCENGSWDPSVDRWGFEGGRVYAAAINCLTLEVYYRYAHVFGTK